MKPNPKPPVVDAFGTRLDAEAVLRALVEVGLGDFVLQLGDEGLNLRIPGMDLAATVVQRAATRVKALFSPFVPLNIDVSALEADEEPVRGQRFTDQRLRPPKLVSLAETVIGCDDFGRAVDAL